jgi:hypothetical protein
MISYNVSEQNARNERKLMIIKCFLLSWNFAHYLYFTGFWRLQPRPASMHFRPENLSLRIVENLSNYD